MGSKEFELIFDPKLSKADDPAWWYHQASEFGSVFHVLMDYLDEDPVLHGYIVYPSIYLYAVAAELYMKTFLLTNGCSIEEIRKLDHKLVDIQRKCIEKNGNFDDINLNAVINNVGNLIASNGGIRYPQTQSAYLMRPQMPDGLQVLEEIVRPLVTREIMSNEIDNADPAASAVR